MHSLHGHAAFAHGSGATFDGARADVSRRKDSWPAGLERAWLAIESLPGGRSSYGMACFDKALFVTLATLPANNTSFAGRQEESVVMIDLAVTLRTSDYGLIHILWIR